MQARMVSALVATALSLPALAHADRIARGVIVTLEAGEAYFDIPADSGIEVGNPARLRHPIRLRHPVSGAWVEDELPVGTATVTMVADSLAMARLDESLVPAVRPGDVIEVLIDTADDEPANPYATEAAPEPLPASDPDTAAVLQTFQATTGARLDVRIAAWERYLEGHGESPYADAVQDDLGLLYELRRQRPAPLVDQEPIVTGAEHIAPARVARGEPMPVAVALRRPGEILAAWLHYRQRGDDSYHRADLRRDGDGYLRGEIPAHAVGAPGVEYFVEVATTDGGAGSAVGQPAQPEAAVVEGPPAGDLLSERRGRSRVSMTASYLDYATFDDRGDDGDHEDVYSMFEVDFFYRLRARAVYGLRVGMGVLNGRGGYRDRPEAEPAGFNYGYTELEFRQSPRLAYLTRLVAGLGEDGLGFGVEGRVRLGPEHASNLTFALSSLEDVGFLSELRMQWAAMDDLPLGFAVAVTDQPNNGDLGVRLTADVGYRALSWFQPTVRVSYQGRSVQHSGVGAGLGLVFDW